MYKRQDWNLPSFSRAHSLLQGDFHKTGLRVLGIEHHRVTFPIRWQIVKNGIRRGWYRRRILRISAENWAKYDWQCQGIPLRTYEHYL